MWTVLGVITCILLTTCNKEQITQNLPKTDTSETGLRPAGQTVDAIIAMTGLEVLWNGPTMRALVVPNFKNRQPVPHYAWLIVREKHIHPKFLATLDPSLKSCNPDDATDCAFFIPLEGYALDFAAMEGFADAAVNLNPVSGTMPNAECPGAGAPPASLQWLPAIDKLHDGALAMNPAYTTVPPNSQLVAAIIPLMKGTSLSAVVPAGVPKWKIGKGTVIKRHQAIATRLEYRFKVNLPEDGFSVTAMTEDRKDRTLIKLIADPRIEFAIVNLPMKSDFFKKPSEIPENTKFAHFEAFYDVLLPVVELKNRLEAIAERECAGDGNGSGLDCGPAQTGGGG